MNAALPAGWAEVQIGEICDLVNGRAFKPADWSDKGLPIVRIQNLNNSEKTYNRYNGEVQEKFIIDSGDLLFAWSGTPGTSFGAHIWKGGQAVLNQHIFKIEFNRAHIHVEFFRHAINQKLNELIDKAHGGVGLRHITKGKFEETIIALPPLLEQQRIVRELDVFYARTALVRGRLAETIKSIERCRNQVFFSAYSGNLTSPDDGRLQSTDEEYWEIPVGWKWKTIEDVAEIQPDLTPVSIIQNMPHIAPDNIEKHTGRLLPYRSIADDGVISAKHRFRRGQIVYSKIRPYLRKAILPDFDGACSADMYPIAPRENCEIRYLFYWLLSREYAQFVSKSEGRSVLPKINMKQMYASPIPWCSIDEQREIVRRIEFAVASLDRIEVEVGEALKLTDRLDQRVLSEAFSGMLVSQDASDEPAAQLVDKIIEERAARPHMKRVGRKATKKRMMRVDVMSSRKRADVSERHLSALLSALGGSAAPRELWIKSEMDLNEFYKLLRDEIDVGRIQEADDKSKLVVRHAA